MGQISIDFQNKSSINAEYTKLTLNEYMSLPYRMELIEDKTEGGYTVIFPIFHIPAFHRARYTPSDDSSTDT